MRKDQRFQCVTIEGVQIRQRSAIHEVEGGGFAA
jgi:hypothetical protein